MPKLAQFEKWVLWRVETRAPAFGPDEWLDRGITGGREAEWPAVRSEQARLYNCRLRDVRLSRVDF